MNISKLAVDLLDSTKHSTLVETPPLHSIFCVASVYEASSLPTAGGFTQGLGLFTLEEHVFLDGDEKTRGLMVTTGPGTYKIPGFSDIPREFNVSLLRGVPNKRAIYSSKVAPHAHHCSSKEKQVYVYPSSPPPPLPPGYWRASPVPCQQCVLCHQGCCCSLKVGLSHMTQCDVT